MRTLNLFFITILIAVVIIVSGQVTALAYDIAVVKNFDDPEIDSLQSYLSSMGLTSQVFHKDSLTYNSVANYDLLIWDDLGFQGGGLTDSNVSVFQQFYQAGKPIYFIGDDLAYSIINLSQGWDSVWTNLLHLSGVNNYSQSYTVLITDTTHPVTNGYYGQVNNFEYLLDIDYATRTNTGEILLANTIDSDVLLVFTGAQARTVTQNCLVVQAGPEISVAERKKLFKNAVKWLLDGYIGINEKEKNLTAKEYTLSQNYPNPFNPVTKIKFSIPPSKGVRGMNVRLVIYDVLGREVSTLINEQLNPGTYEVEWDASNFPSGVYFYRLITTNYADTKKMVIIK